MPSVRRGFARNLAGIGLHDDVGQSRRQGQGCQ
jgi:hypothetical protein